MNELSYSQKKYLFAIYKLCRSGGRRRGKNRCSHLRKNRKQACGTYFERIKNGCCKPPEYSVYKEITKASFVTKAEIRTLEILPADSEYGISEIDRDFRNKLISEAGRKAFSRLLLPMAIRKYIIIFRGLKTLLDGRLTVDVLDGASIGACLVQKNCTTAGTVMFLLNLSAHLEDYTVARTKAVPADSLAVKTDKV